MTYSGMLSNIGHGDWLGEERGVGRDESGKELWNSIVKGLLCHAKECGLHVTDRRESGKNEVVESSWKAMVTCRGWLAWDEAGGSLAGDGGSRQRPGRGCVGHCS